MSLNALESSLRSLFLSALDGNQADYRQFLEVLSGRLRAYLRQHLKRAGRADPGEAEDVLQETLLAIHLSQHTYDPRSPVTAWAHAIARHKLIDYLRRTGRHSDHLSVDDLDLAGDQDEGSAVAARLDINRAMEVLPARTRHLVEQVKLKGFSIAETAAEAGMTETAVKVAIHRGLKVLAKHLARRS